MHSMAKGDRYYDRGYSTNRHAAGTDRGISEHARDRGHERRAADADGKRAREHEHIVIHDDYILVIHGKQRTIR